MIRTCFDKSLIKIFTLFRGIKVNKEIIETWFELLEDISNEDFEKAVIGICRDVKDFYPTTNFVALVRDQLKLKDEDIETTAMLAWSEVVKKISSHGPYSSVKFEDKVIHSCIQAMGGWQEICRILNSELTWREKDFIKLYKALCIKTEHPQQLIGIHGQIRGERESRGELRINSDVKKIIGDITTI